MSIWHDNKFFSPYSTEGIEEENMLKEENSKKKTLTEKDIKNNEEVTFSSPHLCINGLISGGFCPMRRVQDEEEDK